MASRHSPPPWYKDGVKVTLVTGIMLTLSTLFAPIISDVWAAHSSRSAAPKTSGPREVEIPKAPDSRGYASPAPLSANPFDCRSGDSLVRSCLTIDIARGQTLNLDSEANNFDESNLAVIYDLLYYPGTLILYNGGAAMVAGNLSFQACSSLASVNYVGDVSIRYAHAGQQLCLRTHQGRFGAARLNSSGSSAAQNITIVVWRPVIAPTHLNRTEAYAGPSEIEADRVSWEAGLFFVGLLLLVIATALGSKVWEFRPERERSQTWLAIVAAIAGILGGIGIAIAYPNDGSLNSAANEARLAAVIVLSLVGVSYFLWRREARRNDTRP
ncbi:MAG: hypothetical protein ABIP57_07470 [Jatrophihabitantaceae bacterium]